MQILDRFYKGVWGGGINFFASYSDIRISGGIIGPFSMIRVRQSWDTGARIFAGRRNAFSRQAVAPLGGVLNDKSGEVCLRLEERHHRPPPK